MQNLHWEILDLFIKDIEYFMVKNVSNCTPDRIRFVLTPEAEKEYNIKNCDMWKCACIITKGILNKMLYGTLTEWIDFSIDKHNGDKISINISDLIGLTSHNCYDDRIFKLSDIVDFNLKIDECGFCRKRSDVRVYKNIWCASCENNGLIDGGIINFVNLKCKNTFYGIEMEEFNQDMIRNWNKLQSNIRKDFDNLPIPTIVKKYELDNYKVNNDDKLIKRKIGS